MVCNLDAQTSPENVFDGGAEIEAAFFNRVHGAFPSFCRLEIVFVVLFVQVVVVVVMAKFVVQVVLSVVHESEVVVLILFGILRRHSVDIPSGGITSHDGGDDAGDEAHGRVRQPPIADPTRVHRTVRWRRKVVVNRKQVTNCV